MQRFTLTSKEEERWFFFPPKGTKVAEFWDIFSQQIKKWREHQRCTCIITPSHLTLTLRDGTPPGCSLTAPKPSIPGLSRGRQSVWVLHHPGGATLDLEPRTITRVFGEMSHGCKTQGWVWLFSQEIWRLETPIMLWMYGSLDHIASAGMLHVFCSEGHSSTRILHTSFSRGSPFWIRLNSTPSVTAGNFYPFAEGQSGFCWEPSWGRWETSFCLPIGSWFSPTVFSLCLSSPHSFWETLRLASWGLYFVLYKGQVTEKCRAKHPRAAPRFCSHQLVPRGWLQDGQQIVDQYKWKKSSLLSLNSRISAPSLLQAEFISLIPLREGGGLVFRGNKTSCNQVRHRRL